MRLKLGLLLAIITACLCVLLGMATPQEPLREYSAAPQGLISFWSGPISTVPSGWVLCDGNNGTPNLTDNFILSVDYNEDPGTSGGNATVTLSVDNLPPHYHTMFHGHSANDPGHYHSVIDPGHTHPFHDAMHSHSLNDPGHEHLVTDNEHGHYWGDKKIENTGGGGSPGNDVFRLVDRRYRDWNSIESVSTGISIESNSTGITLSSASSAVVVSKSSTNITSLDQALSQINVSSFSGTTADTGIGAPFDNRPEYYKLAFIMKL